MLLYDIIYGFLLILVSPYLLYRFLTTRRYRVGLRERLGAVAARATDKPCIWVHGVSVGELLAARRFIEEMTEAFRDYEIVISTTTDTGHQIAAKHFPEHMVFFFPLDLSLAVQRVLRRVKPEMVVLIELEIWPNFLARCYRENIPVVLVNGRISGKSFRGYLFIKRWLFRPLARIRRYLVQTELYARRFRDLGVPDDQVLVTGSMKNDNVPEQDPEERGRAMRAELGIPDGLHVLCGGSTHDPEESELIAAFLALRVRHAGLRLVLAPRHLERLVALDRTVQDAGLVPVRRSLRVPGPDARQVLEPDEVIILDSMGELLSIYAACDLVFVGGSLIPHGGQNMMEPAGQGRPTVFGPHIENFQESVDQLLEADGALMIDGAGDLESALGALLDDPVRAAELGRRGREAVLANRGATRRTIEVLRAMLVSGTEDRHSHEAPGNIALESR